MYIKSQDDPVLQAVKISLTESVHGMGSVAVKFGMFNQAEGSGADVGKIRFLFMQCHAAKRQEAQQRVDDTQRGKIPSVCFRVGPEMGNR